MAGGQLVTVGHTCHVQSWTRLFIEKASAPLQRDGPLFSLVEAFLELKVRAHPCHISAPGLGLTPATSAPGLGSPVLM